MAVVLLAIGYGLWKPIWDWDATAYLALARSLGEADWGKIHAWTYEQLRFLPPRDHLLFLTWEPFRARLAVDPESLRQVTAFYAERVGYYTLLAGLIGLGVPGTWGITAINVLAQGVMGAAVWGWLRRISDSKWMVLVLAVVMFYPSVMKVLRWSNPDGLVAALMVLGCYLVLFRRDYWGILVWLLMVLCKPNTALWLAPLGLWFLCAKDFGRAAALVGVGMVAGVLHFSLPAYGAPLLWAHTWGAGPFVRPAEVVVPFRFEDYWGYLTMRATGLGGRDLILFGLMWLSLAVLWLRGGRREAWFGTFLVGGVMVQVLGFPGFWERLYTGPVLVLVLLAGTCVTTCIGEANWGMAKEYAAAKPRRRTKEQPRRSVKHRTI